VPDHPTPEQKPEVETVDFHLPNGRVVRLALPPIEIDYNVQMRCVVNNRIVSPSVALAILMAERDFYKEAADRAMTELADAKEEIQHLQPPEIP